MCSNDVLISIGGNEMREEEREICANCKNVVQTRYLVGNSQVFLCSLMKIEASPESSCDRFIAREIALYKKPVPPILKPHEKGFRGFSETFSSFIKTKEGQVISV